MNFYPYSNPTTLTDKIFTLYGGDALVGTNPQREVAYWLSEIKVSENLNTFLLPTLVTGTYFPTKPTLVLEHTYINHVSLVRFVDTEEAIYFTASGTTSPYFSIRDDSYGILDIHWLATHCNCYHGVYPYPYKVQVIYNAGIPTGVAHQPHVLLALTTYATIILNELVGFGNEGPGDVGIESYTAQQYAERRRIQATDFGNSPKAVFANNLLKDLRNLRYVGM